jgi:hypothetical protein
MRVEGFPRCPGLFVRLIAAALLGAALVSGAAAAESLDQAWREYRNGRRLFEERRFGEALEAFKKASELRKSRFSEAVEKIDVVLAEPGLAGKRGDSLSALLDTLALRDLIKSDLESIKARAGGSLQKEIEILSKRQLSFDFASFLASVDLVLRQTGSPALGDSIRMLRAKAVQLQSYPEAEFWIGKAFLGEGETRLAELQFQRAYEARGILEVPEDAYLVEEALADVYRDQGRMKDYELALRSIADASDLFSKSKANLRSAIERTLAGEGFDTFMGLYRLGEEFPRSAYSKLGSFYLDNGRPVAAIYLAASANIVLTKALAAIRSGEPDYAYPGLAELLARIDADAEASRYVKGTLLYRDLLLLGEALSAEGYREPAREIWRALAAARKAEPWSRRAAEDLATPAKALPKAPLIPR